MLVHATPAAPATRPPRAPMLTMTCGTTRRSASPSGSRKTMAPPPNPTAGSTAPDMTSRIAELAPALTPRINSPVPRRRRRAITSPRSLRPCPTGGEQHQDPRNGVQHLHDDAPAHPNDPEQPSDVHLGHRAMASTSVITMHSSMTHPRRSPAAGCFAPAPLLARPPRLRTRPRRSGSGRTRWRMEWLSREPAIAISCHALPSSIQHVQVAR